MLCIPLLEKFGSQSFVTSSEIDQLSGHPCKPNKLRNVNTIRRDTRHVAIQKREISKVKIKTIAFVIILNETHYENVPIQIYMYTENFTTKKLKFSDKKSDIFHVSAQNIDFGYSLEPLRRGGSNEYLQSKILSRNKKNNVNCKM